MMPMTADQVFGPYTGSFQATPTGTPDHPLGTPPPFHNNEPVDLTKKAGKSLGLAVVAMVGLAILLTQVSFRGEIEVRG